MVPGLKLIWLLGHLNQRSVLAAAWLSVSGIAPWQITIWRVIESDIALQTAHFFGTMAAVVAPLIAPLGSAAAAAPPADLVGALGNWLFQTPSLFDSFSSVGLHGLIVLVAAVAAVLTANVIWRRAFAGSSGVAELPNTEWFEYSSAHDLVGRMLLPELRGARELAVSSGGHPVSIMFRISQLTAYYRSASPQG